MPITLAMLAIARRVSRPPRSTNPSPLSSSYVRRLSSASARRLFSCANARLPAGPPSVGRSQRPPELASVEARPDLLRSVPDGHLRPRLGPPPRREHGAALALVRRRLRQDRLADGLLPARRGLRCHLLRPLQPHMGQAARLHHRA